MRESLPFRPGDMSWIVGHEPVVGLAAAPTLLLQVCHPLVAAGVAQYSDFESDPFSRLWRTLFHPLGGWLLMGLGYLILWQAQG